MINFRNTKFVKSATSSKDSLFDKNHVVFVGRSNVGKSSLINLLVDNKSLAFVSKKPGHTKLLNYYAVDDSFYLVDAPGYGFRLTGLVDDFDKMMSSYFKDNSRLKLVVWLLDPRRELSKEDLDFLEFIKDNNLEVIVIYTKSDKINQSEKAKALNRAKKNLNLENVIFTSVNNKQSIIELRNYILKMLNS